MGRRGRKPKPSALEKLDGGASHRRRNHREPKPPPSEAGCPPWLRGDRAARMIWDAEAPGMIRLGLLTTADRLMFAALCERAALYQRASARLRRGAGRGADALTDITRSNGRVARAEIAIAKGALEGLRQLAAAFGMTPADRRGLEVALGAGAGREPQGDAGKAREAAGQAIDIDDFIRRRAARAGRSG